MIKYSDDEVFQEGDIVYCIDGSLYEMHLVKRNKYEVFAVGTGTKSGKIRIKGESDRLVWISDLYFSKVNQPRIVDIVLETFEGLGFNPKNDYIEVDIILEDGSRHWLSFVTIEFVASYFNTFNTYFYDRKAIIVEELNYDIVKETVFKLDNQNEIFDILIAYDPE